MGTGVVNVNQSLYGFEMREPDLRTSDRSGTYDIKRLWQRSHEILGLALQGHSQKVIAEILGISPATVSNTLNSELGKRKLSELRQARDSEYVNVSERIAELAAKALNVYEEIMDSPNVSYDLKKNTADTVIMDVGGHRAPAKIQSQHMSVIATPEQIEAFKRRGLAAAKEAGMLVEVPSEGNKDEMAD